MKKIIIFATILCMMFSAAYAENYSTEAEKLAQLGMLKGTGNGYELDKSFTRAEAATMLVRLLGQEENIQTDSSIFDDVPTGHWSCGYVMYCYKNGITKGTGENTFTPDAEITAGQYLTLLLRLMGYHAEPHTAFTQAAGLGIVSVEYLSSLTEPFLRSDMVYITYQAYNSKCSDGRTLKKKLNREDRSNDISGNGSEYSGIDELVDDYIG